MFWCKVTRFKKFYINFNFRFVQPLLFGCFFVVFITLQGYKNIIKVFVVTQMLNCYSLSCLTLHHFRVKDLNNKFYGETFTSTLNDMKKCLGLSFCVYCE